MMIRVRGVSLSLVASVAMLATALFAVSARAQECGEQADGALCSDCRCCSRWGWCGTGPAYCTEGCQSQCDGCSGGGGGDDVTSVVSRPVFDKMLKHRNDVLCPARGFYTYDAFVAAADTFAFDGFGTTGDVDTRKREVAAFLAQTAHETAGGWPFAPDGPYAWGYCFKEEAGAAAFGRDYCDRSHSAEWPCAAGKKYYGRGPFQLTWNYNYGLAGEFLGVDLLDDPDVLTKDAVVSFETAIWYWMTPRPPKPSSHDVITGKWTPSEADLNAGRVPGYGAVTNVIAGERECGRGLNKFVADRIGFYKRFCDMLGVSYGDNLDCFDQAPFGSAIALTKTTNVTNHANA